MEELQRDLVAAFVFLLDRLVLEVATGAHEAVQLGVEGLDVLFDLEVLFVLLHVLGRLLLRGQHAHGDGDFFGVFGRHHGRRCLDAGLESTVGLACDQTDTFTAPAVPDHAPGLDAGVFLLGIPHGGLHAGQMCGRAVSSEPFTQLFLLLVRVGRVPGDVGGFLTEEARHDDEIGMFMV